MQIADDAHLLGQATGLTIQAVYGGVDYRKQRDQVEAGIDLLVGTPGRLIDYHRQHVSTCAASRCSSSTKPTACSTWGSSRTCAILLRRLPTYDQRQSMLFSATLSYDVMELAYVFMNEAEKLSVTPSR